LEGLLFFSSLSSDRANRLFQAIFFTPHGMTVFKIQTDPLPNDGEVIGFCRARH
jgi:hypothetical protein